MCNTIRKLKAGLTAVIDDNNNLIERAKEIYFCQSTIYADSDDEKLHKKGGETKFYNFLENKEHLLWQKCKKPNCDIGIYSENSILNQIESYVVGKMTQKEKAGHFHSNIISNNH